MAPQRAITAYGGVEMHAWSDIVDISLDAREVWV